jgi:hypothetical protein
MQALGVTSPALFGPIRPVLNACQFSPAFHASSCEEGDAMTNGTRRSVAAAMMVTALVTVDRAEAAANSSAAAPDASAPMARVRPIDRPIGALIRDAAEKSPTFRGLLDAIEASDGIVYIRTGRCARDSVQACLEHRVIIAGRSRILQIHVNPDRPGDDVMGSLGHELRHAIEVLNDPAVDNNLAIMTFYREHGIPMKGVLETEAAMEAGFAVRRELRAHRRTQEGAPAQRSPR